MRQDGGTDGSGRGTPVLYSFRRCPYAIRARMAIRAAGVAVELREIVLRHKPSEMLAASPKGTVPVLVLADGGVIDESLEVMLWALREHDPAGWLAPAGRVPEMLRLIEACEATFKPHLDAYKYAPREAPDEGLGAREAASDFLHELERRLTLAHFLFGHRPALGDVAVFPFVRQFAFVDKAWFDTGPWPRLSCWLERFLADPAFLDVMGKWPRWEAGQAPVLFGGRPPA